jgi:hypothetical protein
MRIFSILVLLMLITQIMGHHLWWWGGGSSAITVSGASTLDVNTGLGKMCQIWSSVCTPGTSSCGYFSTGGRQTFLSECYACSNPLVQYTTVGSCPLWWYHQINTSIINIRSIQSSLFHAFLKYIPYDYVSSNYKIASWMWEQFFSKDLHGFRGYLLENYLRKHYRIANK